MAITITGKITQTGKSVFVPVVASGDIGIAGGGRSSAVIFYNTIEYMTISTEADAIDFGDLPGTSNTVYALAAVSNGSGDRGIFGKESFEYITISSPGNSITYNGNALVSRGFPAAVSNGSEDRGLWAAGSNTYSNVIEWITISTSGDGVDFGDLTKEVRESAGLSNASNNRGIIQHGIINPSIDQTSIDWLTISSTGNASNFGNLVSSGGRSMGGASSGTNERGVFGGGNLSGEAIDIIQWITISSAGNATDYGDLSVVRFGPACFSNGTNDRAVWSGGLTTPSTAQNVIDFITMSTGGVASDFGDLAIPRRWVAGTSNA